MGITIEANGISVGIEGTWDRMDTGFFAFHDKSGGLISINGCSVHLEAIAVRLDEDGLRRAVNSECDRIVEGLYEINAVDLHQTTLIHELECEIYIVPAG